MLDTSPLTTAVERFADRLRAAPQSRLQRGAAAEGLAVARQLAARALELEGLEPRELPDAGIFVVGDQLSVAGRDLAEALRTAETAPSMVLDEAVRLVVEAEARALG
ncbi:hypothetical protein [Streptomyces sp. NPDC086023]|uniref:hypothetical protein n=1 Tax=Streptomyces sp. NPDC086023 TaxID=3365746 RepID=UPI0037D67A70